MSLRAIKLLPSADIHLAQVEPYKHVFLHVVVYDDAGPPVVVPAEDVTFSIHNHHDPPVGDVLASDAIAIHERTGRLSAQEDEDVAYLLIEYTHTVAGQADDTYHLTARVTVHENFPEIWLGDNSGSVNAGSDNFVVSVYAEQNDGLVVDVSGHGFVTFSSPGGEVDTTTGRVNADGKSAGDTIAVTAKVGEVEIGSLDVGVTDAITDPRPIAKELAVGGESTGRRNILFLAEGFKEGQEERFTRWALRIAKRMRKRRIHEPFRMLRDNYRIWTAFPPSKQDGVSVGPRVVSANGELEAVGSPDNSSRLMQTRDTAFGLSYGHRAGEIAFSTTPQPTGSGWFRISRRRQHLVRDWRRQSNNHALWSEETLAWFASLRKEGTEEGDDDHRIGEMWGLGGADQGLVIVLTNDQLRAGTFHRGMLADFEGYLFGAAPLGTQKGFKVTRDGVRQDHTPRTRVFVEGGGQLAFRQKPVLVAIHELAHALFLGDEYEDSDGNNQGNPPVETHQYDNIDIKAWIDEEGATKWSKVERVTKCSELAEAATVIASGGEIVVRLKDGEGAKWAVDEVVGLRTRNLNMASTETFNVNQQGERPLYELYPGHRRHEPLLASTVSIREIDGDRVTLEGGTLEADKEFQGGSLLYASPKDTDDEPMSLVLPGVLTFMNGVVNPLHEKVDDPKTPGDDRCTEAETKKVVRTKFNPRVDLDVDPPPKKQHLIGLYEGGGIFNCDVYRPSGECMMRDQYEIRSLEENDSPRIVKFPFCFVCRHTIVNEINPLRHPELDELYPGAPLPDDP